MNEENILEEWAGCRVINIMCRVSELQIAFEEEKNDYPETFSYKDFKSILNEICIQVQMLYSLLHHGPYVVNGEAKEATDPDVVFLPFAGIFMTAANAKRKTKKKARKEKRLARKYSDIFRKLNKLYSEMEVHDMWKQNSDDKQKINTVLREAKKAGVAIEDYKAIKKDGKLYLLYTRKDTGGKMYEFEIGKYV